MAQHVTKYKTEGGKIRRDKAATEKANKKGAAESKPAADNKNPAGNPAKQGVS